MLKKSSEKLGEDFVAKLGLVSGALFHENNESAEYSPPPHNHEFTNTTDNEK